MPDIKRSAISVKFGTAAPTSRRITIGEILYKTTRNLPLNRHERRAFAKLQHQGEFKNAYLKATKKEPTKDEKGGAEKVPVL